MTAMLPSVDQHRVSASVPIGFRSRRFIVVAILAALAMSSGTRADVTPPDDLEGRFVSMNDRLADVAALAPGFGGMYLEPKENRILYVYSTDATPAEVFADVIAGVLGRNAIPRGGIRVVHGQYALTELREWYERLRTVVWTVPSVIATDLHEERNRLWVGVDRREARGQVERVLAALGIPRHAVAIEMQEAFDPLSHTLQNYEARPLEAAVQIERVVSWLGPYFEQCTLGITTLRNGTKGIVTANHCTPNDGKVDNTEFYQPKWAKKIGVETIDPPFFVGGNCPPDKKCRNSDSAFVTLDSAVDIRRGYVARTTGSDSITVDHNNPRFRIKKESWSTAGETVHKVGRTTGWTSGNVTQTCVDVASKRGGKLLLCQDLAQVRAGSGDSGSPVFRKTDSPSSGDVEILGILWGAGSSSIIFSPLGNVYLDLGASATWDTCAPEFYC